MTPTPSETEVLDRVRRIETRVTKMAIAMGLPNQAQRPVFSAGRIHITSPHTSLHELRTAIPEGWTGLVEIYIGNDHVSTLIHW